MAAENGAGENATESAGFAWLIWWGRVRTAPYFRDRGRFSCEVDPMTMARRFGARSRTGSEKSRQGRHRRYGEVR